MIGALTTVGRDQIIASEEARVPAAFDANPRLTLSDEDRDNRLPELRATLRRLDARRELVRRRDEDTGHHVDRTGCDAEMFLRNRRESACDQPRRGRGNISYDTGIVHNSEDAPRIAEIC